MLCIASPALQRKAPKIVKIYGLLINYSEGPVAQWNNPLILELEK